MKEIELSYGVVQLRDDNILAFRPDLLIFKNYTLDVLKELTKVFVEITDGKPRPYLVDNRTLTGIVNKEEQAFINDNFKKFATKSAIITDSMIVPILVNTFNLIYKPKVEIKLFNKEDSAVRWLLS